MNEITSYLEDTKNNGNKKKKDNDLQGEYEKCWDVWQFGVGLRFTTLAFWLTLTTGLLYLFVKPRDLAYPQITQSIICFLGFLFTIAVRIIENRNKQIYDVCIKRAMEIEISCNLANNTAKGRVRRTLLRNYILDLRCRIPHFCQTRIGQKIKDIEKKLEVSANGDKKTSLSKRKAKLEERLKKWGTKLIQADKDNETLLLQPKDNNLGILIERGIPPNLFSRHTTGINLMYRTILVLWAGLFVYVLFGWCVGPASESHAF